MNEKLVCPGCQAQLVLPLLSEGQTVQCARCQQVFEPFRQRATEPVPVIAPSSDVDERDAESLDYPGLPLRPEPVRGKGKAMLAMIVLGACMISFGVQSYVNFKETHVVQQGWWRPLGRILPGGGQEEQKLRRLVASTYFFHHMIFCAAIVFFLIWMWQALHNLKLLKAEGISHRPITALVSFFIPIVNLYRPYVILQEIWRASHPDAIGYPREWIETPSTTWIRSWWFFSVIGTFPLMLSMFWDDPNLLPNIWGDQMVRESQLTVAWILCAANLCMIATAAFLIVIIVGITRRQQQRYINFYEDPA